MPNTEKPRGLSLKDRNWIVKYKRAMSAIHPPDEVKNLVTKYVEYLGGNPEDANNFMPGRIIQISVKRARR
jgi:hypothetical protein